MAVLGLTAALLVGVAPAPAHAADSRLRFGIYPGGGVGTVNIVAGQPSGDNARLRLAALTRLQGTGRARAFVMHLYGSWDGTRPFSDFAGDTLADVASYTGAGFDVEPTIRYRPLVAGPGAPATFAADVARLVTTLARDPHVVSVQVTNEANVPGSPDAADGAYRGAVEALVRGVLAARGAVDRAGRHDIQIGFNWAAGSPGDHDAAFWRELGRRGGPAFRRALDWVGVDIYPGTWSAPAAAGGNARQVRGAVRSALQLLRTRHFRTAHLPRRVALQVSENGFPTGRGRTEAQQASVMRASIKEVNQLRHKYHITDYRWFDLRDAVSGTGHMENEYGVLRDDYSEKAGFGVLQSLISKYGA